MSFLTRFLGALVVTYFTRRLFSEILARNLGDKLGGQALIWVSNALSFLTWALIAGSVKTFGSPFNIDAVQIYIVPQLFWLGFDLWRVSPRRMRA